MAIHNLRKILLAPLLLSFSVLFSACGTQAPQPEPGKTYPLVYASEYRRLLAQAQQLSFTLDFDELRHAFTESSEYNPHGGGKLAGLAEAYGSVEKAEFGECLKHVDRVLSENYMSLEAHMIGVLCSGQQADFSREDRHRYMVEGLMESIESSGDGKSESSAYRTISTSELRGFVRLKGLQVLDQSIVYDDLGIYDKMQVRDPESGDEYPLFFNVSQQFEGSGERLESLKSASDH